MQILTNFVRWQLRVLLREQTWKISIVHGQGIFFENLAKVVDQVPKRHFNQPFNFRVNDNFCGYWDRNIIYLRKIPKPFSSIFSLFSSSGAIHFKGFIQKLDDNECLFGSYRLNFLMRTFYIIFINLLFLFVAIAAVIQIFYLSQFRFKGLSLWVRGHNILMTNGFLHGKNKKRTMSRSSLP